MVFKSSSTSRVDDVREMDGRKDLEGRRFDVLHGDRNVSETNGQRPRVMSVPLEPASAGPSMSGGAPPPPPVQAQPMGSHPLLSAAQPVRLDMGSGRLPEGGGNASMKQRSVFEGPRGAGAQVREVRLMGSGVQIQQLQVAQAAQAGHNGTPVHQNARVTATAQPMMAQAAAPAPAAAAPPPSDAEIERIIERQLPPQGLTKKEAQQLADALSLAIEAAQKTLTSGTRCFGVDDASIADAQKTRDYLANFAYNAGASDRTDPNKLTPDKLNTVERILECQMTQESGSNSGALLVGGVILGAVGLYLVLNA